MAVEGQSDTVIVAYMRAITFYWCHRHCRGIANDDESMRKICRVDKDDWQFVRPVVFDNDHFFTVGSDGLWHQNRSAELWEIAARRYASVISAGGKRWAGKSDKERSEAMKRIRNGGRNAK